MYLKSFYIKEAIPSLIFFLLLSLSSYSQVVIIPIPIGLALSLTPEHGYLPGKKFPIYKSIDKYDFAGRKLRVELSDKRYILNLTKVTCSDLELTNGSELSKPSFIGMVQNYLDSLVHQANLVLDSTSKDTLKVSLEALDVRLIGYGSISVHGLCQMSFNYQNKTKTYCGEIKDGDKNSPLSSKAFATRKTATRYLGSASIREVIELFLKDLKTEW